jgi:hypothetical protein
LHCTRRNSAKSANSAIGVLLAIFIGGCGPGDETSDKSANATAPGEAMPNNPAAALMPASEAGDDACEDGGALSTRLYGALTGDIEWYLDEMQCQGMPRPDGAGARLRFSGQAGAEGPYLAFIIAIPSLQKGVDAVELPSNVTVIDQSSSHFFSTPDLDSCWTDIEAQRPIEDSDERYRIDGILYCIGPLAEVNGERSVSISELSFSGQLDWGKQ